MGLSREVVITGQGLVSPIGIGCDAFWHSLSQHQSGVRPIQSFEPAPMPVTIGAELQDFDPRKYVKPRKALKVLCRELQTAFAASAMAAEQAGLEPGVVDPDRMGTVFGSEMLFGPPEEFVDLYRSCLIDGKFVFDCYGDQFMNHIYPLWMLKHLPNMAACHVGIAQDARGPNNTIVAGDVSGMLALIEGIRLIDRGAADVMFIGGTGTRVGLTGWMYRGNLGVSHFQGDPSEASRPFDADRGGMVNGEGAAVLILESREHADKRGATSLAEVVGFSAATATGHDGGSKTDIISRTIANVLNGDATSEIGHVNAHGLGTIEDDRMEATAIRNVLGDVPVTGLKSYFGNLGPAGSLTELIGTVLGFQHDVVPDTMNYVTPDAACPVNVIAGQPRSGLAQSAVKISFSPTGQTATVRVRGINR